MKIALIFLSLIIVSSACVYPGGWHMMDWGHMNYGYGGVIMWIILLVLIVVAVYFIVNGGKWVKSEENETPHLRDLLHHRDGDKWIKSEEKETPLEIIKRRYVKGEISKEEFDRMKKDLEG